MRTPPTSASASPIVTVSVNNTSAAGLTASVDVDLKHDGKFTDAGDAKYATGVIGPSGYALIRLPTLAPGTYNLRADVTDVNGNTGQSFGTVTVDPTTAGNPVRFQPNMGQTDPSVKFLANGINDDIFLTANGAVLKLPDSGPTISSPFGLSVTSTSASGGMDVFEMQLGGDYNPNAQAVGLGLLGSRTNYLIGNNPADWQTDVANYAGVQFTNIYPGIDLDYLSNNGQLTYQFVVHPGANPAQIQLNFSQWGQTTLEPDGSLLLLNSQDGNVITAAAPTVYQTGSGAQQAVQGSYVVGGSGQVSFSVGTYDTTNELVIDPSLAFSTYLGGTAGSIANAITADNSGNSYVAGTTSAIDGTQFPLSSNPYQATGLSTTGTGFVSAFDPNGNLVYSTFLGGTGTAIRASLRGIAVDSTTGDVWVSGDTNSTTYPTTSTAFQTSSPGGGTIEVPTLTGLNAAGDGLVYSTYLGGGNSSDGGGSDTGAAVAFSNGLVYLAGDAAQDDFPTTTGVVQPTSGGFANSDYVAKFNPALSGTASLVWSTYTCGDFNENDLFALTVFNGNVYYTGDTTNFGGDFPITTGAAQSNFVGGKEAYSIELNSTATAYIYGTLIGGSGNDIGYGIAVDGQGNAYVTGYTDSTNFPVTTGAFQTTFQAPSPNGNSNSNAFVTKVNPTGTAFVYSTYLGGNNSTSNDQATGVVVDSSGDAYVTGFTGSSNFPLVSPIQSLPASQSSGFVSVLNPAGNALVFSTILGSTMTGMGQTSATQLNAISIDPRNNIYVAGQTRDSGYITTPGAFQTMYTGTNGAFEAVVSKIGAVVAPPPPPTPPGPGPGPGLGGRG